MSSIVSFISGRKGIDSYFPSGFLFAEVGLSLIFF